MTQKLVGERPVRRGGLFRCCVQTLDDHAGEASVVGDVMGCDYESDNAPRMIVADDGAWEWVGSDVALAALEEELQKVR